MFVMRDVFCRFGNLIDVYVLQRKNVGYAKYASVESANEAIKVFAILFILYILVNAFLLYLFMQRRCTVLK